MQYVNPWWRSRKLTTILSKWRSGDKLAINKDQPGDFLTNIGTTIPGQSGLLVGVVTLWAWIISAS